jgi:hypothetical protein
VNARRVLVRDARAQVARNPLALVEDLDGAVREARVEAAMSCPRVRTSMLVASSVGSTRGADSSTSFLHISETDCMAGHIGFELRCAERKFISLRCRVSWIWATRTRLPWSSRRMIFSARAGPFLTAVAFSLTLRAAHRAVSLRHIEVRIFSPRQVGFELRCAGRRFSSCKLRRGAMFGWIQE